MKWFAVWNSLASHPKWMALPLELRGAWITLMVYASVQQPIRWRFRDSAHAELLLRRDGAEEPAAVLEELVRRGWLDVIDEAIEIHDHEDWQRYPSDMPEERADRKRRSRGVTTSHDPVTSRGEEKRKESVDQPVVTRSGGGPASLGNVLGSLAANGLDPQLAARSAAGEGHRRNRSVRA